MLYVLISFARENRLKPALHDGANSVLIEHSRAKQQHDKWFSDSFVATSMLQLLCTLLLVPALPLQLIGNAPGCSDWLKIIYYNLCHRQDSGLL